MKQEKEVVARFSLLNTKDDWEAREVVDDVGEIHEWELGIVKRDKSRMGRSV